MHIQGVQLTAEPIPESKNSLIECTITIYIILDFFFIVGLLARQWTTLLLHSDQLHHTLCSVHSCSVNIQKPLCMLQYK